MDYKSIRGLPGSSSQNRIDEDEIQFPDRSLPKVYRASIIISRTLSQDAILAKAKLALAK
ncbi:MAG TPA: hypothetical protein VJP79_08920 [Nitrososphaera sp.]|nr:hypothetical protein [Nitrososphaera sp.]